MKSVWVRREYHLEDVHGLVDAVGAEQDEVVGVGLDVEADDVRDAAQVGLHLPLHLVLVVLQVLSHPNYTLYSNWPKQRLRVHLPMSRSYCTKPPAASMRLRSSPLLLIRLELLEGGQCSFCRVPRCETRRICSRPHGRCKPCFRWWGSREQCTRKSSIAPGISYRSRSRVQRRSCS